jgi:hypothetical protein
MMYHVPVRSRRLRWLALNYGALVMLWLSREDNDVVGVTALGCGLSLLLLTFAVISQFGGRHIPARVVVAGGMVLGLLAGLGTAVATTGLMLFKNALHAHLFLGSWLASFSAPRPGCWPGRWPVWAWGLRGALDTTYSRCEIPGSMSDHIS